MKGFYLKPKLFSVMKTYTKQQFINDIVAGIIVAIIALPLSIALALASGVEPACGVYTAKIIISHRCHSGLFFEAPYKMRWVQMEVLRNAFEGDSGGYIGLYKLLYAVAEEKVDGSLLNKTVSRCKRKHFERIDSTAPQNLVVGKLFAPVKMCVHSQNRAFKWFPKVACYNR